MHRPGRRARTIGSVFGLVVLLTLAGCGGFTGGNETPTVTPAPVPEPEFPNADNRGSDGVEGRTLIDRHQAVIGDTSYTLEEIFRVGPPGNARYSQQIAPRAGPNHEPLYLREQVRAEHPSVPSLNESIWWDGEIATFRHILSDDRTTIFKVAGDPTSRVYLGGQFAVLLESMTVTTVEPGPNDTTVVAGTIDRPGLVPSIDGLQDVENTTVTIRVRPDGIIDRLVVGYDASYYGEGPLDVRYAYRVEDIGTTALDLPAWLEAYRTNGAAGTETGNGSGS